MRGALDSLRHPGPFRKPLTCPNVQVGQGRSLNFHLTADFQSPSYGSMPFTALTKAPEESAVQVCPLSVLTVCSLTDVDHLLKSKLSVPIGPVKVSFTPNVWTLPSESVRVLFVVTSPAMFMLSQFAPFSLCHWKVIESPARSLVTPVTVAEKPSPLSIARVAAVLEAEAVSWFLMSTGSALVVNTQPLESVIVTITV